MEKWWYPRGILGVTNAWTKRNGYDIDGYCMIVQNGSPDRGIQMIVLAVWSIWDTDYEEFLRFI